MSAETKKDKKKYSWIKFVKTTLTTCCQGSWWESLIIYCCWGFKAVFAANAGGLSDLFENLMWRVIVQIFSFLDLKIYNIDPSLKACGLNIFLESLSYISKRDSQLAWNQKLTTRSPLCDEYMVVQFNFLAMWPQSFR